MPEKFPGLLEKFGCMALEWDCKAPAGVRPRCRFDHDAIEMKHCYGVTRSEESTMVEYNLSLEAFFHAMEALNWAIRVSILVEEKGQPSF